jgi:phage shock protein E
MNWTTLLIVAAVVVVLFWIKRAGQISSKDALAYLKKGAQLIDVRSPGEFNSGHLPSVINIPLDEIEILLPRRAKDKNQVLLLHCQSGMRSGAAVKKLKSMGYVNAFNLGSYGRAKGILQQSH